MLPCLITQHTLSPFLWWHSQGMTTKDVKQREIQVSSTEKFRHDHIIQAREETLPIKLDTNALNVLNWV